MLEIEVHRVSKKPVRISKRKWREVIYAGRDLSD